MIPRSDIVEAARSWLDVRWRHQGRSRDHGIDCVGLVIKVAHELDLTDFDLTTYSRIANPDELLGYFRIYMDQKPVSCRRSGDVLILKETVYPIHCGIVSAKLNTEYLIHATVRYRKTVEEPLNNLFDKILFCFAFRGIVDG